RGWQYFRDRGAGQALSRPPYNGAPIEPALGGANRTIQSLDESLSRLPGNATRQATRVAERTQQVRRELELLRDAVERQPSEAGPQALERLTRQSDDLTRAAREYAQLQRPQLPRNTRVSEEQLAAHQQATQTYIAEEARLRANLDRRIADYSQNMFRSWA